MPIKSFKEKLTNLASGEVLGSTDEEIKRQEEEAAREKSEEKRRRQGRQKPPAPKKEKPQKGSFFKRKNNDEEDEPQEEDYVAPPTKKKSSSQASEDQKRSIMKEAVEGYQDVILFLGIKEDLKINPEFYAKDLDYIEFSQTTPLGFDFDEVTDFISRVKYTMSKLESAVKQRDKDIVILASEVKKVEEKMTARAEAAELERMMGAATKEERLAEENMELQIKVNQLEQRIVDVGSPEEVSQLRKAVEILTSENDMLRQAASKPQNSQDDFGMPSLDNIESLDTEKTQSFAMPSLDDINNERTNSFVMPKLD